MISTVADLSSSILAGRSAFVLGLVNQGSAVLLIVFLVMNNYYWWRAMTNLSPQGQRSRPAMQWSKSDGLFRSRDDFTEKGWHNRNLAVRYLVASMMAIVGVAVSGALL